jgi:putative toxin-antitoxin system antitoxin component (TIGR02293 family)
VSTTPTNTEMNESQPPARFISLSVRAGEVFANREKALAWLGTPNPSLQGRAPIEAASTEEGFELADEILTRIEHGVLG